MHQVVLKRLSSQGASALDTSPEYPKVVRHAGLFLVEFGAVLEGETHSTPIGLTLGLSQFGEMVWIQTESLKEGLSAKVLGQVQKLASEAKPPIHVSYNPATQSLRLGLLEEIARRERAVGGILIVDAQSHITSIVVSLR